MVTPSNLLSSVSKLHSRVVENLGNAQRNIESNTQLCQQRMTIHYDKTSCPVPNDIGSKVWVYTPKSRKSLSQKQTHNFHGPYRVVAKLSPVHLKLQSLDNKPVSVPVHANRMKPYYDPSSRPIVDPPNIEHSSDLAESDLPEDSFQTVHDASAPLSRSSDEEQPITCPEDDHPPAFIRGIRFCETFPFL